jgi:tRNA(Arg) A34 adenosine deaminase TadA
MVVRREGRKKERKRADGYRYIGEISAINNCSAILTDPEGEHKLSPLEALEEFKKLSLYTNAEPCPMVLSSQLPSNSNVI